ncbi:helix-turn-helix transcriptional regulator [Saccharicrinis aurantiacus]|uniref:helix-turn-helix transcriptional regulator n=1 Tax=Saccharicrinis aurantiacus TaxID=1849719 RepID=UPI0024924664|nr:hypothetical protein [Saccharicrinis aurantiacus]
MLEEVEDSVFYYPDVAEKKLSYVVDVNNEQFTSSDRAYVNYISGVLLFVKGDIDSSFIHLEKATNFYLLQNDNSGLSKCQFILGNIAEITNQFEQAKINYFESIANSDNNNFKLKGLANLGLARCYRRLDEDYLSYFKKGSRLLSQYGSKEQKLYSEYMGVFIGDNSIETKIKKFIYISNLFKELGLENRCFGALNIVSMEYRSINQYDSAHLYVDFVLDYFASSKVKDAFVEPSATQLKALIYYDQKDYVNAENWLNKSLNTYEEYGLVERQYYAYNILYEIDVARGDYKAAFEHLSLAFDRKEQTNSIAKQRVAKLAEISSDIASLKQSLQKLRWERLMVILVSSFSIVIALLILYIVIRKKNQREQEILLKNNELEKIALNTQEKLRLLKKQGVDELASSAVSHNSLIEDLEFAYGETYNVLKQEFVVLSKTELRYALMFVLDYSNDVICSILSVQVSAVRKAKQRIKQKLELDSDASLEEIFKSKVREGLMS